MNNMRSVLTVAVAGFLTVSAGITEGSDLFTGNEISADFFGFGASRDKSGHDNWAGGTGVGFNYFFNPYLGVGADSYADAFVLPYLINGSAIFRYPISGSRIAPYGFAGFGRQWDDAAQWTGHVGGGAEFGFNPRISFFADIREVIPDQTKDYTVLRFGLRFKFR